MTPRPPATASPRAPETILVVEDNKAVREGLGINLRYRGYRVLTAADGDEGLRRALDERPDLVLLDIMLPGCSGLELLAALRAAGEDVPVLVLSARGALDQKIEGLNLGADDYVTKPFELPELIARVEALLRRRRTDALAESPLSFGQTVIDPARRRVTVAGREVALSAKELDLLCLLARSPGRPLPRETILARVWGHGFDGTARTVDNFIRALRQKIEADPARPRHIVTVRQVGYRLDP